MINAPSKPGYSGNIKSGSGSGSGSTYSPDAESYISSMSDTIPYKLQARLGPERTLGHLITAHKDRRFASDFSLAATYDSPATAIPIPGLGNPNERSDNIDIARSGGYHLKPEDSALENTVTIPGTDQKQENPYQSYSQYRKTDDNPVKKQDGKGAYKIFSIIKDLEKKIRGKIRQKILQASQKE